MKEKGYQIIAAMLLLLTFAVVVIILSRTAGAAYISRSWNRNETRIEDMSRERYLEELYSRLPILPYNAQEEESIVKISEPIVKTPGKYSQITMTEEEYELLAKVLYLEARGESFEGQQAVVEVVFNRVMSTGFPDTVEGVLMQTSPCVQFVVIGDLHKAYPNETQYAAIEAALQSEGIVGDAVYFSTKPYNDNTIVRHIGGHYFCK